VISEIGGANALIPLLAAAECDLPVVDADANGRAFPELQMNTFLIGGLLPDPLLLDDGKAVVAALSGLPDALTAERYARALTWAMGASAGFAHSLRTTAEVRRHVIPRTLSLALAIGRGLAEGRRRKLPPVAALAASVPAARHLFDGKVVDVERRTTGGFARGRLLMEGLGDFASETLAIDIQNEFLIAYRDGVPVATVPDIISLIEEESGLPLGTEALHYGLRLTALGIPAAAKLKTEQALRVVGPRAFGYDVDFRPLPGDLPEAPLMVAGSPRGDGA
jgi:DUF917 family protein